MIIGAAGFLGRAFVGHFRRQGNLVFGVDLVVAAKAPLSDLAGYESLHLPDEQLGQLFERWKPDVCIHCGGLASVVQSMIDPGMDYKNGPALTFFLLDSIRRHRPDCGFIMLSSAAVYGNPAKLPVDEDQALCPISTYGYHKLQSEILCQEFSKIYSMRTAIARLFSAYGPGLRRQVIWDIVSKVQTQTRVVLEGSGRESRDFLHAVDVALAVDVIVNVAPMKGEAYNIASGEETMIRELSSLICKIVDAQSMVHFSGALPNGVPLNWRADISRIRALGFTPSMTFESGLKDFVHWCLLESGAA